jgi:hypothetical protein
MKKQSIMQAILNALDETDDSITKHMNQLIKWARYCEKSIGSLNGYKWTSKLFTVNNSEIILPDDCYRVLFLISGDHVDETNLRYADLQSLYINVDDTGLTNYLGPLQLVWQDLSYGRVDKLLWEEVGNIIQLADQYDNQSITVVYQYIETDEKGYWMVNDSHVEAIKRYLVYMIAKKYLWNSFKSAKMLRGNEMQLVETYKRDYNFAIRDARAQDQKESPIDTKDKWRLSIQ